MTVRETATVLSVIALAAVLICVAGCAAGPASRPDPAAPSARTLERAAAVLTNDATTLRQRWRLFNAQQLLDQRCMRKLGLRYLITSAGPEPPSGVTTADVLGSGSSPGYGVPLKKGGGVSGEPAQDQYVRSLPSAEQDRYVTALNGPADQAAPLTLPSGDKGSYATGGCTARTQAHLYGSVRAAFEDVLVPQDVNELFNSYLAHDRQYQTALGRWQRCMVTDGRKAQTPAALIQSLKAKAAQGMSPASLDRHQRAAATADRRCDAKSGLRATLAARREAFLRQQPQTTLSRLEGVWQLRQQALRRAAL
ncbi:hypothetical protein ABT063_37975 [Streptomyces sp. NPDC002838]|uniref:hypothetical protein n=1 Tax=Streptomyces sp. NPDC002838 TaxID=3154436 RepID=UPI00331FC000